MRKIAKLFVLPLLTLLASCDVRPFINTQADFKEDTKAHDELFLDQEIKFENGFDPLNPGKSSQSLEFTPNVAVQFSPVVDGKINIRFIAAINADLNRDKTVTNEELTATRACWYRALYAPNGEAVKVEAEMTSSKAYTAINTGGGEPYTIDQFNESVKGLAKRTHFITYVLRGVPYATYANGYITAYCKYYNGSKDTYSKFCAAKVDGKTSFAIDRSSAGRFLVTKVVDPDPDLFKTVKGTIALYTQGAAIPRIEADLEAGTSLLFVDKEDNYFKVLGYSDEKNHTVDYAQDGQSDFIVIQNYGHYAFLAGNNNTIETDHLYLHKGQKYEVEVELPNSSNEWYTAINKSQKKLYSVVETIDNNNNTSIIYYNTSKLNNTFPIRYISNVIIPEGHSIQRVRMICEPESTCTDITTGKDFSKPLLFDTSMGFIYTYDDDTWRNKDCNINIVCDPDKGTPVITGGEGYYKDKIVLNVTTTNPDYVFSGWVGSDDKFYGITDAQFSIASKRDFTMTAIFVEKTRANLCLDPLIYENTGEYQVSPYQLKYGLYPQTNVNDVDSVNALNELTTTASNGYYYYNGEYYAKTVANQRLVDESGSLITEPFILSSGEPLITGNTYWFRCEPIVWDIIDKSFTTDTVKLFCHNVLDIHEYKRVSSFGRTEIELIKYDTSDVRTWLNDEFYNSAFGLESSRVKTVTVDNSYEYETYQMEDTEDKVYLLSKDEITAIGSPNSTTNPYQKNQRDATDYAIAKGLRMYTKYGRGGRYLTRTPGKTDPITVVYIAATGVWSCEALEPKDTYFHAFTTSYCGICPGITIQF